MTAGAKETGEEMQYNNICNTEMSMYVKYSMILWREFTARRGWSNGQNQIDDTQSLWWFGIICSEITCTKVILGFSDICSIFSMLFLVLSNRYIMTFLVRAHGDDNWDSKSLVNTKTHQLERTRIPNRYFAVFALLQQNASKRLTELEFSN